MQIHFLNTPLVTGPGTKAIDERLYALTKLYHIGVNQVVTGYNLGLRLNKHQVCEKIKINLLLSLKELQCSSTNMI